MKKIFFIAAFILFIFFQCKKKKDADSASCYVGNSCPNVQAGKEVSCKGYIQILSKNPEILNSPFSKEPLTELSSDDFGECARYSSLNLELLPKENEFASISQKQTVGSKIFYKVMATQGYDADCPVSAASGWIESSFIKFLNYEEMSNYTLQLSKKNFSPELVCTIHHFFSDETRSRYPLYPIDWRKSSISLIKLNSKTWENNFLVKIKSTGYFNDRISKEKESMDYFVILNQNGTKYKVTSKVMAGSVKFFDLNSDNIPEILVRTPRRGEPDTFYLQAFLNGAFQEILIAHPEYEIHINGSKVVKFRTNYRKEYEEFNFNGKELMKISK